MKALTLAAALITATTVTAVLAPASAFAADAQSATDSTPQTTMMAANTSAPSMQSAEPAGKTRAEVYQELLRAEKSGEMQRLNSTLYAN